MLNYCCTQDTTGDNLPEIAMVLNITGLTALPCRVYVVALQYSTLLPLFSSTCRVNVNMSLKKKRQR